jgi:hypothetical protein
MVPCKTSSLRVKEYMCVGQSLVTYNRFFSKHPKSATYNVSGPDVSHAGRGCFRRTTKSLFDKIISEGDWVLKIMILNLKTNHFFHYFVDK